ncbi:MAG TPA: hypothetical protein VHB30_05255 [Solirubrobacteraceae bacterium]|nr:hypothetical protein [Solirubrobacteraceae bacterium]
MIAQAPPAPVDPNPCHHPALHLLCPDWVMSRPTDLHLRRTASGRVLLQMTNSLVNVGAGPVKFVGTRYSETDMYARQVIRRSGGRPAMTFRTGARLHYTYVDYRRGNYWKFAHAARFELWRLDGGGRRTERVAIGPKLDYCNRDLVRRRGDLPGSPPARVFGACSQDPEARTVTLGTSVGWVDRYPWTYPSNWIDVTGRRGCFAILMRADPNGTVWEADEANNASSKVVRLPFRHGAQRCPRYDPRPPRDGAAAGSRRRAPR